MKKYTVNVHYDYVTTVEVEADNEEEAIDMAESIAVDYTGECVGFTNSCITNVEDLDLENII